MVLKPGYVFTIYFSSTLQVQGELIDTNLFLHCDLLSDWGMARYRECLYAMRLIKAAAKEHGIDSLHVFIPRDDKLLKFEQVMGFTNPVLYKDNMDREYLLLEQDTA